jgi:uncharacterized protein YdeI (YjbR/CyaY-like superfamily)
MVRIKLSRKSHNLQGGNIKPRFFKSQSELRSWLDKKHDTSIEIWIGFYKKDSGKASVSYLEAVDEALCFGWIDGIRKKIDLIRYTNRFTPRRPKSNWSKINIENVKRLKRAGRMKPSGLKEVERAKADGRIE